MSLETPNLIIRTARSADAPELCEILNEIICLGGTTALEAPLTAKEFARIFSNAEGQICCYVATNQAGQPLGFQVITHHPDLPNDWADIATFARGKPKTPGVGTRLFGETKIHARKTGISTINATIRADNHGGLAYYERIGFRTYSVRKGVPLQDGTPVDRISKSYVIERLRA